MTTRLNWQSTNHINDQSIYTTYWRYTNHLTLMMTSAQDVETLVNVTLNSPSQDYTHLDDRASLSYDMTPGFKPFTTKHDSFFLFSRCIVDCNIIYLKHWVDRQANFNKILFSESENHESFYYIHHSKFCFFFCLNGSFLVFNFSVNMATFRLFICGKWRLKFDWVLVNIFVLPAVSVTTVFILSNFRRPHGRWRLSVSIRSSLIVARVKFEPNRLNWYLITVIAKKNVAEVSTLLGLTPDAIARSLPWEVLVI